jgi:nucleoside-diphosphate-sugar epimerase
MASVLVTGSNGYVGSKLIRRLEGDNHTVVATARSGSGARLDVTSFDPALLIGMDTLVHLAALVHKPKTLDSEFLNVNVKATLKLAQASENAGVKKFIYLSTIGVHGNASDKSISEDSPLNPQTPYARSKRDAETELQNWARNSKTELIILRPTMIYGPQAPGSPKKLISAIRLGLPLPFGSLTNRRSFLHIDNLTDLIAYFVNSGKPPSNTYVVSDFESGTPADLAIYLANVSNLKVKILPFPPSLLKTALNLLGRNEMVSQLCESLIVDCRRLYHDLNWRPLLKAFEIR